MVSKPRPSASVQVKQDGQQSAKNITIYIDLLITTWYKMAMGKRKMYNTTLDADLIKEIRILAAQLEKRQNDLLEEAIQDLLKKYKSKSQH